MELENPFKKYGVKRVINAATSVTILGGSIPPETMFDDMKEAGKCFVYIPELQAWAGEYIAEITGAESGLPVAGAVAGLQLAAAACMMKGTELEKYDPLTSRGFSHITKRLPMHTEGLKNEFIVQRPNRNSYDWSVELAGGVFQEVGGETTTVQQLDEAFNSKTAAYYFTARNLKNSQPLDNVIEVAHRHGVPVIVDAAAEIPPKRKLKLYIEMGVDLVVYSGGKHIAGPNNSGLLAGRRDLVKLAHLQSYPFNGVGRAAKMSRETIVGLVSALKTYVRHDEKTEFSKWLMHANNFMVEFSELPGVKSGLVYQRVVEDGEPMAPFCYITLDKSVTGINGSELVALLKKGDPCIFTLYEPEFLIGPCPGKVVFNPQYMLPGEHELIVNKVKKILKKG